MSLASSLCYVIFEYHSLIDHEEDPWEWDMGYEFEVEVEILNHD